MTKRRNRPKSPEQVKREQAEQRARDFEAVGLQADASVLPMNAAVEVDRESQATAQRARRADAFDLLKDGMRAGSYDAVRKLERDLTIRRGEHDRGRYVDRVDGDKPHGRTDAMIAAGERVDAVLSRIGERDAWLLQVLLSPTAKPWREIVAYITGETDHHAQGAAVRSASANLADAYRALERKRAA